MHRRSSRYVLIRMASPLSRQYWMCLSGRTNNPQTVQEKWKPAQHPKRRLQWRVKRARREISGRSRLQWLESFQYATMRYGQWSHFDQTSSKYKQVFERCVLHNFCIFFNDNQNFSISLTWDIEKKNNSTGRASEMHWELKARLLCRTNQTILRHLQFILLYLSLSPN